jgi:hypothetical protein
MRLLYVGALMVLVSSSAQAQIHEVRVGFSDVAVEVVNNALAKNGTKSRIGSVSVWNGVTQASALNGVRYIRGEVEIKCGSPIRKVEVARTHFVVPSVPQASASMLDSLKSEGWMAQTPDQVVSMMTVGSSDDQRAIINQLMMLGLKVCNTTPSKADYIALTVWHDTVENSIFPPMVMYKVIDSDKYQELISR